MADVETTPLPDVDLDQARRKWLDRLAGLVDAVDAWAEELGWSTRRIAKTMEDPELGRYEAPALLLQREFARGLLEPISHRAPGVDGVVDLYLMPAYDDVASLYFSGGEWRLYRTPPGSPAAGTIEQSGPGSLSKEILGRILESMTRHAGR